MRKNQFRSILLAALVVTAIGGLNSCKDYDDDIAELRNEIRNQSTDLNSLVADKVHNLEIEANNLQAQLSSLETAYKNADAALQTSINNAVADAKNAAAGEAASKAEAAEKAANSYADVKAAEAQRAAVAAATTLVTDAQNALKGSIDAANATLAEQGKTITGLLQADKELQQGITTATARANEAYTLASQALDAAKAAQAAAEKAQGTADEAKLQAAQNATNLATIAENLKNAQETLNSQINVFGQQVTSAAAQAAENKAKIEGQATQLADMKAANQKAQDAIDALGNKVNDQVEALKGLISNNQKQIEVLQNGLDAVKGDVASLQTAVAGLIAADNDIQTKIDNLFGEASARIATLTNGQADNNAAIKSLQDALTALQNGDIKSLQDAVKGLEGQIASAQGAATEEIGKATAAVNELKGQLATLQGVVDALTANAVSQTDIDNAVNALATTVGANYADLKGQIDALKGGIPTAAAIAAAAKAAADEAVNKAVGELLTKIENGEFNQDLSGINTAISTLQEEYGKIDDKIASEVTAKINELKPAILSELEGTIKEGDEALQSDIDVLAEILAQYFGIDLNDKEAEVKLFAAADEGNSKAATLAEKLKEQMNKMNNVSVQNKVLSSVTLIPRLYIGGIEAIEFKTLIYNPRRVYMVNGRIGQRQENNANINIENIPGEAQRRVDNKNTTALYRLSPNSVDDNSYLIDQVSVVSNVANTRAAVGPEANSLVSVNKAEVGVGKDGTKIMTVYLKKNDATTRLANGLNADQIRTIALKVPKNPNYAEAEDYTDVYSEYSRIVETEFTPYIAALPYTAHATYDWQPHYSDYTDIYASLIDANDRVTKEVYYKEKEENQLNLFTLVTGDYSTGGNHIQITKDELKQFGLAFRFSIPKDAYNDVTHRTDQQQFAKLRGASNHIIYPVLPDDPAYGHDNEAVVGKEPIVCVTLEDTVNNKLVDQRYFKIKWINKKLADIHLDDKENLDMKLSCTSQTVSMTWKEVINNVYGKIKDENGNIVGMSQSRFEQNYPIANMTWDVLSDEKYVRDVKAEYGSADGKNLAGADDGLAPIFENTTNAEGDAILIRWKLGIDEIGTLPNDGRTFKIKVNFKSGDSSAFPDLWFYWTVKYTLPANTSTVGKNTINWCKDDPNILWVLPVQYNTSTAGAKVKYDFNLLSGFTRPTTGNEWVVRNMMGACPAWDFQFATKPNQNVLNSLGEPLSKYDVQYHYDNPDLNYQPLRPYTWAGDNMTSNFDKNNGPYTWSIANGATTQQTTEKAYVFYNQAGQQVLNIDWGGSHPADSWVENAGAATASLKADNTKVYPILNPLKDEMEKDGVTPQYSHTKQIKMNIWGELNPWNYYEVGNSPFYLAFVEPIRVDANFTDYFVDGIAGGSKISCAEGLTMTDFAGYVVRETAFTQAEIDAAKKVGTRESSKQWAAELYTYYGITNIQWDTNNVKYGLKVANNDLVADETVSVDNVQNKGMTSAAVSGTTSGGVEPSVTYDPGTNELIFKNLGGQNVGFDYNAFIPVKVTYELGTITRYVKIVIHPRGYSVKKRSF